WAVDVPDTLHIDSAVPRAAPPPSSTPDDLWAQGPARPVAAPEPPPAAPAPRRPVWVSGEPSGPWGAAPAAAETVESAPRMPSPASPVAPASPPPAGLSPSADFARDLARGAGLPETFFVQGQHDLAEQIGALLRLVTENLQQLLNARGQSKRLARMSQQTTIEALNNNPLKFAPSAEEALRIMFGAPTQSYLDAPRALEEAVSDGKDHRTGA